MLKCLKSGESRELLDQKQTMFDLSSLTERGNLFREGREDSKGAGSGLKSNPLI